MEHVAISYRNTELDQKIVQNRQMIQKISSDLKESEVSNNNLLQRYFVCIFKHISPFTFHFANLSFVVGFFISNRNAEI